MSHRSRYKVAVFLALLFCGGSRATAQSPEEEARQRIQARIDAFYNKSVEELVQILEQDPGSLPVVQRLRVLDDPAAIDPLKRAFEKADGLTEKRVIARALLSLGVGDGPYFDFMAEPSRAAAKSGIPYPLFITARGEIVPGQFSPSFLSWCKARSLDPRQTFQRAAVEEPSLLMILAYARDPRAAEIFLRTLDSPNLFVVSQGIMGLAILGRAEDIEPIKRAILRFPRASMGLQAAPLLLFDQPEAQEFVRQLLPDEAMRAAWLRSYREILPASTGSRE